MRQSILRNVSHELRTPLNAILGFCDVLKNDTLFSQAKEKTKGYLDHIHSAGHELLGTITEVMDFAAIQSGSYKAEWEKTDINILMTDVVRELELKYPDRIFSTALGEEPLFASVDVVLYGKILRNIIDNAVRFSGVETKVDVSLKEDSSRLIWATISDKGPGISATRLANIQRSFTYEQNTMTKTHSGLGIGLAYVNHASRLMGAKVNFDSVTGQGTTIAIGIPMASKASIAENSVSAISI
ncbi:MAG: HAMP domain-containing histidine kinase [Kordiimonadaceae bacterium]|nr:HAMP domain-containing histidine kinase [Kordiimonadaceae bacterium]